MINQYNLHKKVAIVTGGSKGIGKEIAKNLLISGSKVALLSRSEDSLKKTCKELSSLGEVISLSTDVKNYSEIPLGWTKEIKFSDFKKQYKSFDLYEKYVFIGMGGSISMSKIASFINPKKILFLDNFDISNISKIKETTKKEKSVQDLVSILNQENKKT